jgi:hypothetical protein
LIGLLRGQGNRRRNSRPTWRIAFGTDNVDYVAVSTLGLSRLI